MATPFGAEQKRGPRARSVRPQNAYSDVQIRSNAPALNNINPQTAFGNLVDAPTDAAGNVLQDNMGRQLTPALYGSGRTKQRFSSGAAGTARIPLIGAFYAEVVSRLPAAGTQIPGSSQVYPALPQSEQLFVAVDNASGALPESLGTDDAQALIAQGTEAGTGYVQGKGRGAIKVGSQGFKNALVNGLWSPEQERDAVAFAMYMGGPQLAQNLANAGYRIGADGSYSKGNARQIKTTLAAKSGNKVRNGTYAFAMRANQQHGYFEGGDDPRAFAAALQQNRDQNGLARPGSFPMNRDMLRRGKGGRARSGAVFVPRDSRGAPLINVTDGGDMNDPRFQCRAQNSGPGISDFKDVDGSQSAGFRLFRRANQKTGTVTCGYTPDIFVNTVTSSYNGQAQEGQKNRVMAGENLAQLLNRRGQAAAGVEARLQQGYQQLNQNRSQFYGRSLKRKPAGGATTLSQMQENDGSALSPQDKVNQWSAMNGGV